MARPRLARRRWNAACHHVGACNGELERIESAARVTNNDDALDAEMVEERLRILVVAERTGWKRGLAETTPVICGNVIPGRQGVDLSTPHPMVQRCSVNEQEC